MKGLKFWVIEFCWLDSTVSTAELFVPALEDVVEAPFELVVELVPPQPATTTATASAQPTVLPSFRCVILRLI